MPSSTHTNFEQICNGTLYSLMSWAQFDAFWSVIDPTANWYLYAVGQDVPQQPSNADAVRAFLLETEVLLKREHEQEYCGIVYADDIQHPNLVKIYDPHQLGSSCGSSGTAVLPGWVMSRMPPVDLKPVAPVLNGRKRWWAGLWPVLN
jgi:hypothetical protein